MIKTITTTLLALLLTACSPSDSKDTNSSLETTVKTTIEEKAQPEAKSEEKPNLKVEIKEPILTINTLDNREIHLSETSGGLIFQEYKDKAVFVVLFGYRCPPCLKEMPNLIAIMKKNYPDLEIIAIEVQGLKSEELKRFKEIKGINYTVAVGRDNNPFINYIASRAQWQGSIPFFLAFNKKGEVKIVHVGALSSEQLEAVYSDIHK